MRESNSQPPIRPQPRGRGAASNAVSRFAEHQRAPIDDGWWQETPPDAPPTEIAIDRCRSAISRNDSPDIPFDRSVNPYRGCEHGCIYCYARPTHAWLGLSPGLDFERRLFHKPELAERLRRELADDSYRPATLVLGANTDPYQPVERRLRGTRRILEVLAECRHPVAITTKSALVLRDIDLLAPMASLGLAAVQISITTLDRELARRLEPRAASPGRRLRTVAALHDAGIPVGVLVSPVIPGLTDSDLERIVGLAAEAGAERAGALLIRLPLEIRELFREWLETHYPQRAEHVLSLIRQCRGGLLNDPRFGHRMRGEGPIAELLQQRVRLAARRRGLRRQDSGWPLATDRFRRPILSGQQLGLWD
jgi:DNA repair photolyase